MGSGTFDCDWSDEIWMGSGTFDWSDEIWKTYCWSDETWRDFWTGLNCFSNGQSEFYFSLYFLTGGESFS
jgi:hypothetical protein